MKRARDAYILLASKEAVQVRTRETRPPADRAHHLGGVIGQHAGSSATRAPAKSGQGRGQSRAKVAKSEYRDLGEFLGLQSFFFY